MWLGGWTCGMWTVPSSVPLVSNSVEVKTNVLHPTPMMNYLKPVQGNFPTSLQMTWFWLSYIRFCSYLYINFSFYGDFLVRIMSFWRYFEPSGALFYPSIQVVFSLLNCRWNLTIWSLLKILFKDDGQNVVQQKKKQIKYFNKTVSFKSSENVLYFFWCTAFWPLSLKRFAKRIKTQNFMAIWIWEGIKNTLYAKSR